MELSRDVINEFVKMTKDDAPAKSETNTYGTVVKNGDTIYVKFDGSELLTPTISTTNVEDGERVMVMIKNHTAVITGNITAPSARTNEVKDVDAGVKSLASDLANVKILMADKVSTNKLEAQNARIEELASKTALIDEIKAENVEISGNLKTVNADISYLKSDEAFIEHLNAITARINEIVADKITTDDLYAALADITVLAAGTATFDKATVKHLVSEAMNLEYGSANQVFIKNLAVEFAQMVSASVGELCIKASDGNYYLLDVGADGSVKATKTTVSNSEIAAGETSGGKVILETNISASTLNTSNLLATYALINRIDAARIDVDQLFAREAFISLLRTTKIVGDQSITMIATRANKSFRQEEMPIDDVIFGDTWRVPSTGATYQAEDASDCGLSFYLNDDGCLYYDLEVDDGSVSVEMDGYNLAVEGVMLQNGTDVSALKWSLVQDSALLTKEEFQHYVRVEPDGLHVGAVESDGEVRIDSDSVDVLIGGRVFSSFGQNYVEFGNYQLRRTADGGLAFKMR